MAWHMKEWSAGKSKAICPGSYDTGASDSESIVSFLSIILVHDGLSEGVSMFSLSGILREDEVNFNFSGASGGGKLAMSVLRCTARAWFWGSGLSARSPDREGTLQR